MSFPKRDELSFRTVLALPNASRMWFDCKIRVDTVDMPSTAKSFVTTDTRRAPLPGAFGATAAEDIRRSRAAAPFRDGVRRFSALASAMKFRTSFVVAVLPAPDSPLMTMDCGSGLATSTRRSKATFATWKTCGGSIELDAPSDGFCRA